MSNEYFDADMGNIWVQPGGFGTQVYRLLCADSDGFSESFGDVTTRMCRVGRNNWKVVSRSQGLPSDATLSIEAYLGKTETWMQKQARRRCPLGIYIHLGECGEAFLDYEYGQVGKDSVLTGRTPAGIARGKADAGAGAADASMHTYDVTASPLVPEYWKLREFVRTVTTAEPEPARDFVMTNDAQCAGGCGTLSDECEVGDLACDSAAIPAANGYHTANGWAATNVWAALPFAVAEDIASITAIRKDKDTVRLIAACGTAAAAGLRIAYSDDNGTTWTVVVVDASATDYAFHGGALWANDWNHVWFGTFEADMWFSADGGLTWTDQAAPVPGANESIYSVHFVDNTYGWAVGGDAAAPGCLLYKTTDGGVHWADEATEPSTDECTGVRVLDSQNVRLINGDGEVYLTRDWGASYEHEVLPDGGLTAGADIDVIDHYAVAVCGYLTVSGSDYPALYRSFNGGADWEQFLGDTAFDGAIEYMGLNSLHMCSYNQIISVGEIVDAKPIIFEVRNAQPA